MEAPYLAVGSPDSHPSQAEVPQPSLGTDAAADLLPARPDLAPSSWVLGEKLPPPPARQEAAEGEGGQERPRGPRRGRQGQPPGAGALFSEARGAGGRDNDWPPTQGPPRVPMALETIAARNPHALHSSGFWNGVDVRALPHGTCLGNPGPRGSRGSGCPHGPGTRAEMS